jgi:uncharacterized MAPEG superfamily protein
MTAAAGIATEFWWLGLTGLLMAATSLPYVMDRILTAGFGKALGNPQDNRTPHSPWAERIRAAHYNCVENVVVFGPLLVAVVVSGLSSEMTVIAAMAFALSRIAYVIIYTLGIPLLRTLAFLIGWLATVYLALVLMGIV